MKTRNHITAFYVEALLLIVVFVGIIMVLTGIFGQGIMRSSDAKALTESVILAENAAEMAAASDSGEELLTRMNENNNARTLTDGVYTVEARYNEDLEADENGRYIVDISWEPEGEEGGLVKNLILVSLEGGDEPVYTLESAVYVKEGKS